MRTHARAVVIGGGVVGVSTLYHLARKGWSDVVLCERTELTAGSTWHAAGLLPLFNMSYGVGQLHKYSVDLYKSLPAETGQDVGFHVTGNLRLATNDERMDEYRKYCGTANTIGVPFQIVSPAEIAELWPLCNTEGLVGALYHPDDGHIAPADVTQALATGARNMGAEICRDTPVGSLERKSNGEWLVGTSRGDIVCEHVVCATGNYSWHTSQMLGIYIPAIPVEHQYVVTDEVPELVERHRQGLPEMAVLRESDASYYLREERQGYILGPYEKGAPARFSDGVPDSFERDLFPGDLDRLMPHLEAAIARVPSFERAGIKDIVNGPIAYTPDGSPLVGPAWNLHNVWLNEGHSFGITAAGGAGWQLAEWIVEGEPSIDMMDVDPRRFGAYANKPYVRAKNEEAYEHVFIVHYPDEERPGRAPGQDQPDPRPARRHGGGLGSALRMGAAQLVRTGRDRAGRRLELSADQLLSARGPGTPERARECRDRRHHRLLQVPRLGTGRRSLARPAPVPPPSEGGRAHQPGARFDLARRGALGIHRDARRRGELLSRELRRGGTLRWRLPREESARRRQRPAEQPDDLPRNARRRGPQRPGGDGEDRRGRSRQRGLPLADRAVTPMSGSRRSA